MRIENVSIVGMGALGVLFGDMLARALGPERVGFVADAARRARYAQTPVTVNGRPCAFRMIDPAEPSEPDDLVIFAVKGPALERAMADAAGRIGPDTALISLLNGISSERELEARFGARNVVYCVAQGMDAVKLGGALTYSTPGQLCLGAPTPEKRPALDAVCELFGRAGVPYVREADILHRIWGKFMLNVGVNQTVMVCEGTYGTIQVPGAPRERMISAMREVMALAALEGVPLGEDDLNFYLGLLDRLDPDAMPSMRQDGLARRPSEVELFSGTVRALAKKHGLSTPVNDALYAEIRAREAAY